MGWTWRYDPDVAAPDLASPEFPSQADAESWVGETWRELLDAGVGSVTLLEDGEPVYGPMDLRPAP
jgi:hypothetical protein